MGSFHIAKYSTYLFYLGKEKEVLTFKRNLLQQMYSGTQLF